MESEREVGHREVMKLYFSPLACSMATRIALYEAAIPADYQHVNHTTRRAPDGTDLREVHPLGYVPVLRLDDGAILTENAAILQQVAALAPPGVLAPAHQGPALQQWLSFIGTELHKAVFAPLLERTAPDGAKDHALANAERRLPALASHLEKRAFVLDTFSVADAYLITLLNWTQVTPIRLSRWPALAAYATRLQQRRSVARALADESRLFVEERGRPVPPPPPTGDVIQRFNDVFQRHDPAALDELVADDCAIENVDGVRHAGKAACLALWRGIATDPALSFTLDEVVIAGEHATIRWRLSGTGAAVRAGVNVMRVRGGRVVEARGYLQGA